MIRNKDVIQRDQHGPSKKADTVTQAVTGFIMALKCGPRYSGRKQSLHSNLDGLDGSSSMSNFRKTWATHK